MCDTWADVEIDTSTYFTRNHWSSTITFMAVNYVGLSFLSFLPPFSGGGRDFLAGLIPGGRSASGLPLTYERRSRHLSLRLKQRQAC